MGKNSVYYEKGYRRFHSSLFPIPDSRFPTPDSRLPTPYSLLPTSITNIHHIDF
ncbi:MAG: hypothetical protein F6J90_34945 [Moorea sp. SIOASIH]|uniref:hypothetical protein n=1 Tax=Moorena sp. SIOASIH TaxID=2607817 RepID=UPI0013BB3196|nr:hypothetical protein [Moorena sp. SIOASIH]NEO41248.1 hypothetical protein [Moorena sp. SIOASIH]